MRIDFPDGSFMLAWWYDTYSECPMVFEVDDDGMVGSREVREWLGY